MEKELVTYFVGKKFKTKNAGGKTAHITAELVTSSEIELYNGGAYIRKKVITSREVFDSLNNTEEDFNKSGIVILRKTDKYVLTETKVFMSIEQMNHLAALMISLLIKYDKFMPELWQTSKLG